MNNKLKPLPVPYINQLAATSAIWVLTWWKHGNFYIDPAKAVLLAASPAPPSSGKIGGAQDGWDIANNLSERVETMKRALEPFIEAANDADGYDDVHPIGCDPQGLIGKITVGDLRRAREALSSLAKHTGEASGESEEK